MAPLGGGSVKPHLGLPGGEDGPWGSQSPARPPHKAGAALSQGAEGGALLFFLSHPWVSGGDSGGVS